MEREASIGLGGCGRPTHISSTPRLLLGWFWGQAGMHACDRTEVTVAVCLQVKSDRHVDHDTPIEELQEHSVKHIRKEHHAEDVTVETKS